MSFYISFVHAQDIKKPEASTNLKPLKFVKEEVTDIFQKGKTWIIDEQFALKHKSKPIDHAPFALSLMPTSEGKIFYKTRPEVAELIRISLQTPDKKLAESIRFTTITITDTVNMDARLSKAAEIMQKQIVPGFAKGQKDFTVNQIYKTKVGPYDAAAVLGKITLKDDSTLFIKTVSILREKNTKGLIAIMLLDPSTGKKEQLMTRLKNGYMQQVLHSMRFLKQKPKTEDKPTETPKEETHKKE